MNIRAIHEFVLHGKYTPPPKSIFLLPIFFLFLIIFFPFPFIKNYSSHQSPSSSSSSSSSRKIMASNTAMNMMNRTSSSSSSSSCDIFSGEWVRNPKGAYYDDESCYLVIEQQRCLKNGRSEREYLNWRWKPQECELPLFDATLFLENVRGKSMAFLGDSVGLNQMYSLLCLLSTVSYPKELAPIKQASDHKYFKRFFFEDYNFTMANFWSPYLVASRDNDQTINSYTSMMNLYVDEADETWAHDIKNFDYVIISVGHWFFRPLMYHENGKIVGCHLCHKNNTPELTNYYGYKMAFRTTFKTLMNLEGYKGVTILRTFSPSHFENGEWNNGGSCPRTTPFGKEDVRLEGSIMESYLTQVVEFKEAEKKARKKGLKFWMMDITELMLLRPDGHPNKYGHSKDKNVTIIDCVHWCLPGPIDTWNEILLYKLRMDSEKSSSSML